MKDVFRRHCVTNANLFIYIATLYLAACTALSCTTALSLVAFCSEKDEKWRMRGRSGRSHPHTLCEV